MGGRQKAEIVEGSPLRGYLLFMLSHGVCERKLQTMKGKAHEKPVQAASMNNKRISAPEKASSRQPKTVYISHILQLYMRERVGEGEE